MCVEMEPCQEVGDGEGGGDDRAGRSALPALDEAPTWQGRNLQDTPALSEFPLDAAGANGFARFQRAGCGESSDQKIHHPCDQFIEISSIEPPIRKLIQPIHVGQHV